MTDCQCTEPGFCERHNVQKSAHWLHLCQTRQDYFQAWEEGKGPGQRIPTPEESTPRMEKGPGTELKKMLGCGCGCQLPQLMNVWGIEGCNEHLEEIVRRVCSISKQYNRRSARRLVSLAIKKASTIGADDGMVLRSDNSPRTSE